MWFFFPKINTVLDGNSCRISLMKTLSSWECLTSYNCQQFGNQPGCQNSGLYVTAQYYQLQEMMLNLSQTCLSMCLTEPGSPRLLFPRIWIKECQNCKNYTFGEKISPDLLSTNFFNKFDQSRIREWAFSLYRKLYRETDDKYTCSWKRILDSWCGLSLFGWTSWYLQPWRCI